MLSMPKLPHNGVTVGLPVPTSWMMRISVMVEKNVVKSAGPSTGIRLAAEIAMEKCHQPLPTGRSMAGER